METQTQYEFGILEVTITNQRQTLSFQSLNFQMVEGSSLRVQNRTEV
jgi:hypothetical protein